MSFKNGIFALALLGALAVTAPAHAEMNSLARLLTLGQNQQCTYQKTDDDGTQSGTIYLADGKMRGEIQTATSGMMNMLREGDWQYMWGDALGAGQGIKMPASAANSGRNPQGQQQGPDFNEEMDMQCQAWSADASKFTLPADVQFMDLGAMMPGMGAAGGGMDMHALQCGACSQAPEAERAQCLQMMGC